MGRQRITHLGVWRWLGVEEVYDGLWSGALGKSSILSCMLLAKKLSSNQKEKREAGVRIWRKKYWRCLFNIEIASEVNFSLTLIHIQPKRQKKFGFSLKKQMR